jgi:hypothetical protein
MTCSTQSSEAGGRQQEIDRISTDVLSPLLSLAMSAKKELWLSLEVSGQNSTIV